MKYLGTNEVGRSKSALGFPSVKTCMAIVYQTDTYLFGFHDAYANDTVFGKKAEAFQEFVQSCAMTHADQARCLVGVITTSERFGETSGGKAAWSTQLHTVATRLGFNGPIWGVRVKAFINNGDSSYMRFDYDAKDRAKRCMVSYQSWSRMEFADTTKPKDAAKHALLTPRKLVYASAEEAYRGKDSRPFDRTEPTEDNRPVRWRGHDGEGVMIVVEDNEFIRFR